MRDKATAAVVSAGGVIGALARYGAGTAWPSPWSTLVINVVGCLAMGCLMVVVVELRTPHPLVRPFLGIGVLGGFTTFSSYCADFQRMLDENVLLAFTYLLGTLALALMAVTAGARVTRRLAGAR
ncbi:fluoride efflux transporter FluC [Actinokineospora globicatena]|uniref:fluoride efflux transporter FluC n=1 Tax=Actinokineospora globicatena TaxID=103729 RepID=UPI0020A5A1DF|nr:CrcB family protein [Actinokineospora globicatena]MCP2306336.1 camphor resistance protein CrcB [Actinokineospora globicatena]